MKCGYTKNDNNEQINQKQSELSLRAAMSKSLSENQEQFSWNMDKAW